MSDILLNQGASTKRPASAWFWSIVAALMVLAVWGFFALTSRPKAAQPVEVPVPTVEATAATPAPAPAPKIVRAAAPPPAPAAAAPAAATSASSASLLAEAQRLKGEDDYQAAREKLEALLSESPGAKERNDAESLLGEINTALIMSPRQMPEKIEYTVQSGDTLDKIARKYGTSVGLVMKGNNLSRSMVRINERLRVFTGAFTIKVDKSDNTLTLFLNDKFFKRYRVGTGQYNKTPVGTFKITDKIAQPTWWRADGKAIPFGDPENLLGTHWLAIDVPGYGIHGTWETNTIGKQSSAGCIRLLNPDIEELFTIAPVGTPVTIED